MASKVSTPDAQPESRPSRAPASNPLGQLSKLPLEIREQIYGITLQDEDIEISVDGQVRCVAPLLLVSKVVRQEALHAIPFYVPVIIRTPKALLDLVRKLTNRFRHVDEGQLPPRPPFPRHLRLNIFNPATMRQGCLGEITETGAWYRAITAIPIQCLSSLTFHFNTASTTCVDIISKESRRRNGFVTTLLCRLGFRRYGRIYFYVHALEGDFTQRLVGAFNNMRYKYPRDKRYVRDALDIIGNDLPNIVHRI